MPWYAPTKNSWEADVSISKWSKLHSDRCEVDAIRSWEQNCRNGYYICVYLIVDLASVFLVLLFSFSSVTKPRLSVKTCDVSDLGAKTPWVMSVLDTVQEAQLSRGDESFEKWDFFPGLTWTPDKPRSLFIADVAEATGDLTLTIMDICELWMSNFWEELFGRTSYIIENLPFFPFPKLRMPVPQSSRAFFTKFVHSTFPKNFQFEVHRNLLETTQNHTLCFGLSPPPVVVIATTSIITIINLCFVLIFFLTYYLQLLPIIFLGTKL